MIEVKNLVKRYGDLVALDHFDLSVEDGEIFGLLGPNGSGKTTAINCMLGLLKYEQGEVNLFGKPMTPTSYEIKREIGVVMQNVAVFEELTVQENVEYFCSLYVKDRETCRKLTEEAMEFVGIQDFRKMRPKKLSGGLLRRLNIACGIAHKPKLIFMDEPTVAVDPQSRNNILEGIQRLCAEGATVVYTTHYMEEAEQLCSRIMIMDKGRAIATGTKEELKAMIRAGEKMKIEVYELSEEALEQIRHLPEVREAQYEGEQLIMECSSAHALISVLDLLRQEGLAPGRIFSEPPTLNDVFLEMTGKQLRD